MSLNRDQIAHEYILSGVATTVHSAFQLADAMIAEAQKRKDVERPAVVGDGWIRVEDRLPSDGDVVLCFFEYGDSTSIEIYEFSMKHYKNNCITHWQQLPNPPKGVSK